MKRYGQVCPVARALDVIGDRWSLLIVRDLALGPRRYSDLQDGLLGIGPNVLATRLRDLQDAGIVDKRTLPRPTPVTVYELTEAGRALGPTISALRAWGSEHAPSPRPGDAVRPAWVLMSAAAAGRSATPGKVCELRIGTEVYRLVGQEEGIAVQGGASQHPDAVIALEAPTLYALVAGEMTVAKAMQRSEIEGDAAFAAKMLRAIAGTVTIRFSTAARKRAR
jgi:DNA-binding HxlR family transcriptional regulator